MPHKPPNILGDEMSILEGELIASSSGVAPADGGFKGVVKLGEDLGVRVCSGKETKVTGDEERVPSAELCTHTTGKCVENVFEQKL